MTRKANLIQKPSIIFAGLLLVVFIGSIALPSRSGKSVSAMKALDVGDTATPTATLETTPTPTFTTTPTVTPTPLTGLTLLGWSKGCTTGPYITCSAAVTSTHTDPYRWDFDITYSYNDNRTNFGSTFTLTLSFATGVFYTGVPIYWNMYPIANEVMPNQRINVIYSGVSDLNPMAYPSGIWTIPSQPSPYQKFDLIFSRGTSSPEILVRTDKWHLTLSTYPNTATPTTTPTPTVTPSQTPTSTATPLPTNTPSPTPQDRWYTGNKHNSAYGVKANISAPATAPMLSTGGMSSYVTTATTHWIQTGWRHWKDNTPNWPYTLPMQYVEMNPPAGYIPIIHYDPQNWGEVVEYKINWSSGLQKWCAYIDGVLKNCIDLGFSPPTSVNAHSEVHFSPQNELSTTFLDVNYLDTNNVWQLFDLRMWREDAPYQVNKFYNYEYYNYGP